MDGGTTGAVDVCQRDADCEVSWLNAGGCRTCEPRATHVQRKRRHRPDCPDPACARPRLAYHAACVQNRCALRSAPLEE